MEVPAQPAVTQLARLLRVVMVVPPQAILDLARMVAVA